MARRVCSVEDCETYVQAWGWCSKHYQRWQAHGDVKTVLPSNYPKPAAPRFLSKTEQVGDCWIWTSSRNPGGYGLFTVSRPAAKRRRLAHRVAYELFVGPIPEGLTIDHLCRQPACVNPNHLEPVPVAINIRRGVNGNSKKTHCSQGHPYDGANTGWKRNGGRYNSRYCKTCTNARNRDAHRRRALAAAA